MENVKRSTSHPASADELLGDRVMWISVPRSPPRRAIERWRSGRSWSTFARSRSTPGEKPTMRGPCEGLNWRKSQFSAESGIGLPTSIKPVRRSAVARRHARRCSAGWSKATHVQPEAALCMLLSPRERVIVPRGEAAEVRHPRFGLIPSRSVWHERFRLAIYETHRALGRAAAGDGAVRGHGRLYRDFRAPRRGRHVRADPADL